MSRISIPLPENFSFSTRMPIRITDINYGGHVGNDTVLSLVHEARMQFLYHLNYSELDLEGVGLIMRDAGIEFKKELFYGDEIEVFVTAEGFTKVGFDLYYKLVRFSDQAVAATAKTGMICYDYDLKKVVKLPGEALEKLQG